MIPQLEQKLPKEDPENEDEENGLMIREKVTSRDIASVVSKTTGIPVTNLLKGEREKLLHMEEQLSKVVIGQPQAISAISNAVRLSRSGLHSPNRPLASFLFLGSTGVGKTLVAQSLAKFLFNSPNNLTRLDMSEYMEKHSISSLIGAPPGYVGFDTAGGGGELTEAVRRKPYSVVLLDEFEKAHRDVANLLLQVLDEGKLTDRQGRTVDFRNTMLIMTSNLGAGNDLIE